MFDKTLLTLSKTDYLIYRECKSNAWYKINKPDIYSQFPLSEFELSLMENGRDIELLVRQLFPSGALISGRGIDAQEETQKHIQDKTSVIFQAIFNKNNFLAAVDVLKYNPETNSYSIFEIKSTNKIDTKIHYYDLAFQVNLLRKCGLKIESISLIHLNKEYVRSGDLNINLLFKIEDITREIEELCEEVSVDMNSALEYLSKDSLSDDFCFCVYKGRSRHCTTFSISNPNIPKYSVHDINRIGNSKKKLAEMINGKVFDIDKVPLHIELSSFQRKQIEAYQSDKILINKDAIARELNGLEFPLYFLDYESFPPPVPRFDGFSPYMQMPFQYSLHVLKSIDDELKHLEFLYTENDDPTKRLVESLQKDVGTSGSVIVWHKTFECIMINNHIAERLPEFLEFIESLNSRVFDLEEIFLDQHYVHKGFLGKTSIKNIMPILAPELSYKALSIQEGTAAFLRWNELITGNLNENEKREIIRNLRIYCGQDSLAMYKIWKHLHKIIS